MTCRCGHPKSEHGLSCQALTAPSAKCRCRRFTDAPIGRRVQLHPGTDQWMMGDRYGTVVKALVAEEGKEQPVYRIKLDKSKQHIRVHPKDFILEL